MNDQRIEISIVKEVETIINNHNMKISEAYETAFEAKTRVQQDEAICRIRVYVLEIKHLMRLNLLKLQLYQNLMKH